MSFGELVKWAREARGWKRVELAEAAAVSYETISRVERGHAARRAAEVRIARALDIEPPHAPTPAAPLPDVDLPTTKTIPSRMLGQRIKARRLDLGWTREHLASVSGVSYHTIVRTELGRSPRYETFLQLAETLRTGLDVLAGLASDLPGSRLGNLDVPREGFEGDDEEATPGLLAVAS